jgi:site-specific recombinase XerD
MHHLDGRFLYTLTLTDLASGWTECIPLLEKSADAVLAALQQARKLFPFPLLGIDTDSGSEFLNGELIAYCEQEQLTFTRGRPGVKNDQCHIEQKNGAVVRETVGCVRLVGRQAYFQLREVYRALRLVVNCFQPSMKLQAKVYQGERVRRVYDVARTPLQRLMVSEVLSEDRQHELSAQVQQLDPLALSEHLDALQHALLCGVHLSSLVSADGTACPQLPFALEDWPPVPLPMPKEEPERIGTQEAPLHSEEILSLLQAQPECTSIQIPQGIGHQAPDRAVFAPMETLIHGFGTIRPHQRATWKDPWSPELIRGGPPEPLPAVSHSPKEAVLATDRYVAQTHPLPAPASRKPSSTNGEHEVAHLTLTTLEQAIAAYVQEMRATGRTPKTLQWHQTSLEALRRYLRRQFRLTGMCPLTSATLRTWLTELSIAPSPRTGVTRAVSTVVAYARSARAFCNWLVRQRYVSETFFPQDAIPKAQRRLPQAVEPEVFVRLLRACQLPGSPGGLNAGLTARNRAILWLLRDTGLRVSELCGLRLNDVDRARGTVTARGKKGHLRTFPLSGDGQRAVCAYLDRVRLTSAWEPAVPEAQDRLLLTERRHPLTRNSLTLLLKRLSQRAGFTRRPICPSMLRDTYAIRFVHAGGGPAALREQLGVAALASVKRYQHCGQQYGQEREAQVYSEESVFIRQSK